MNVEISVDLQWPSYEEDIEQAIKEEVISQVKVETRRQSKLIREAVAKKLMKNQEKIVNSIIENMNLVSVNR